MVLVYVDGNGAATWIPKGDSSCYIPGFRGEVRLKLFIAGSFENARSWGSTGSRHPESGASPYRIHPLFWFDPPVADHFRLKWAVQIRSQRT